MTAQDLASVAQAMVAPGKGILAADESDPTIKKRFDSIGAESTEENRRNYREMLFTTPGAADFISGVILFDETIRQSTGDGKPFAHYLTDLGVVPGIKVDKGAKALAGFPGEKVTEGLDGLRDRLSEYYELGARFAKWRAVITIGDGIPSDFCLLANAHALARYAALCQEANIVPIVEPEVLMDGAHSIERCEEVTAATLKLVFAQLDAHGVSLPGMVLKPNMVISGSEASDRAGVEEVAEASYRVFVRWPVRCGSHRPSQRHESFGAPSLGADVFVWTSAAGSSTPGLGRKSRRFRRWPVSLHQAGPAQRPGPPGVL